MIMMHERGTVEPYHNFLECGGNARKRVGRKAR